MESWGISWQEIENKWTDEQLNLFILKRAKRLDASRRESTKAQARASGHVVLTDDEVAQMGGLLLGRKL